jgi:hypothetical protein
MAKEQTLPEALQLDQTWYDNTAKRIEETFGETTEKISEFIDIEATNVREEEFGEIDVNITKYERKLVLLGYLIGLQRVKSNDPMSSFIEFLLKEKGKGGE